MVIPDGGPPALAVGVTRFPRESWAKCAIYFASRLGKNSNYS